MNDIVATNNVSEKSFKIRCLFHTLIKFNSIMGTKAYLKA